MQFSTRNPNMVSLFYFALTQTIQKYMFGKLKSEFSWFLTIKLKFEISVFALYLHKTSEKHIGSSYTKMISALSSTKPDTQNTKIFPTRIGWRFPMDIP